MVSKKKAIEVTENSQRLIYTSNKDIGTLIELHAMCGYSELEIFVDKKKCKKYVEFFRKKGFYCRLIEIASLKEQCILYMSWISDL